MCCMCNHDSEISNPLMSELPNFIYPEQEASSANSVNNILAHDDKVLENMKNRGDDMME